MPLNAGTPTKNNSMYFRPSILVRRTCFNRKVHQRKNHVVQKNLFQLNQMNQSSSLKINMYLLLRERANLTWLRPSLMMRRMKEYTKAYKKTNRATPRARERSRKNIRSGTFHTTMRVSSLAKQVKISSSL